MSKPPELSTSPPGNGDIHLRGEHPSRPVGEHHAHVPTLYSPKTRRAVTLFSIIAAVALIVIFVLVELSHKATDASLAAALRASSSQAIAVDVVRVEPAGREKMLSLPGDAHAFYQTTIFARTTGYVREWKVDIGDRVTKDQVLATIETPELDDQLNEAKARVSQLKAQAAVAGTSRDFAKLSFNRWEAAAPDGVVSAQERDQKKSELESAGAKLDAANAEVNLGAAELQRLETLESFKEVKAPFAGVITSRRIDIGDLVTAGSTTNTTPLFAMAQYKQIRVLVDVPQPAVPDIHVGMRAYAVVKDLPDCEFVGIVDRTASSIDPHSRSLNVEVLVDNPDLALIPGTYVQVNFETLRKNPPLRIPAAALTFGPEGPRVAVVGTDGMVTIRPVTILRDLGYSVEVGSGLSDQEQVALNIGNQVVSGEKVDAHLIAAVKDPESVRPARLHAPATQPTMTARLAQ